VAFVISQVHQTQSAPQ